MNERHPVRRALAAAAFTATVSLLPQPAMAAEAPTSQSSKIPTTLSTLPEANKSTDGNVSWGPLLILIGGVSIAVLGGAALEFREGINHGGLDHS